MVRNVSEEPSFRDSATDLGELILKTAEGLADRGERVVADADSLALAESAVGLHARVTGKSSERFLARSRVPGKLAEAAGGRPPCGSAGGGPGEDGRRPRDGFIERRVCRGATA